jgi:multisubunit Na+/H+ antiporter MnhB subunit
MRSQANVFSIWYNNHILEDRILRFIVPALLITWVFVLLAGLSSGIGAIVLALGLVSAPVAIIAAVNYRFYRQWALPKRLEWLLVLNAEAWIFVLLSYVLSHENFRRLFMGWLFLTPLFIGYRLWRRASNQNTYSESLG